jgi:hypothetical protein
MNKKRLRSVVPALKFLENMNPEDRIKMLPYFTNSVHKGIDACIYNATCNKHMPIGMRKVLKKHTIKDAETYKYLLKPNISSRNRQVKLQQIGGSGLGLILRAVVPVLDKATQKGKGADKKSRKVEKEDSETNEEEEEDESEEEEEEEEEESEDSEEVETEEETSEESEED